MQKTLWTLRYHWKTIVFWLATVVALSVAYVAHAATLEIPGPNSTQSGIQLISGWKCTANGPLTIRFNGGDMLPLLYGSERRDTRKPQGPCDDANTGFIAIMNWSNLGDGEHTAVVCDNGVEFDRTTFRVVKPGPEFLWDVQGEGTATLSNGQRATLAWSEPLQGFVATHYCTPELKGLTVFDGPDASQAGSALWQVYNDCDPFGLDLTIGSFTDKGFTFDPSQLEIEQRGRRIAIRHFEVYKLRPNPSGPITSKEHYREEYVVNFILHPSSSYPLDFSLPFVMFYNGQEIFTFP